jgi:hypothetical protein
MSIPGIFRKRDLELTEIARTSAQGIIFLKFLNNKTPNHPFRIASPLPVPLKAV